MIFFRFEKKNLLQSKYLEKGWFIRKNKGNVEAFLMFWSQTHKLKQNPATDPLATGIDLFLIPYEWTVYEITPNPNKSMDQRLDFFF